MTTKSKRRTVAKGDRAAAPPSSTRLATVTTPPRQKRRAAVEKSLAPRMMLFAKEYLVDRSATEAAKRAGYTAKSARRKGSDLLHHPQVKALIDEGLHKLAAKIEATAERVVEEMAYVGFADMAHFVKIGDDGIPRLDLARLPDGASRAISEVTTETRCVGEETITRTKLKLHPKTPALSLLAQHLGILVQKHQHQQLDRNGRPTDPPQELRITFVRPDAT